MSITSIRSAPAAAGLIAGAAAFGLGDLLRRTVDGSNGSTTIRILAAVHAHPGRWQAAGALCIIGALLILPGLTMCVRAARRRGSTLTTVGVCLLAMGLVAAMCHAIESYAFYGWFDRAGLPAATATTLDATSYPLLGVVTAAFIVGVSVGQPVLFLGLRRAGLVPLWAVGAAVLAVVTGMVGGVPMGIVGSAAWVGAYLPLAVGLTRAQRRTVTACATDPRPRDARGPAAADAR